MTRNDRVWAYFMVLMIIAAFWGTTDQVCTFLTGALLTIAMEKNK